MTWFVGNGTLKVGLMNTDKYVMMSINMLFVFAIERIASAMEEIKYSVQF
jgi:hypothetical protein